MQKSQSDLAKDAAQKQAALGIDRTAHKLRNTSRGLEFQDGVENFDNTSVHVIICRTQFSVVLSFQHTWANFLRVSVYFLQVYEVSSCCYR